MWQKTEQRAITGVVDWVAPSGVSFRAATSEDAREIAALWNRIQERSDERRFRLPFADLLDTVYQRIADPAGRFLLAFDAGALVGMVHATVVSRPAGLGIPGSRQMHLSMLAVDPDCWRRGLGRLLVARCLELAKARRVEAVRLWTHSGGRGGSELYKRLGFRFDHRWKLDGAGGVAVQYRYALD